MIRGVFFDMGGVLLCTEDRAARRAWEDRLGLPEWGLSEAVFENEASRRAGLGQGTVDEIWAQVAARFAISEADMERLQADFWQGDKFDEPLFAYIASLRPRYRTGLISNAWPNMRAYLEEHAFVTAAFERMYFSAEVGIAKPDERIYRQALEEFGLAPQEAVFVDDLAENIAAAQQLGMAGIQYQAGLDVPAALAELGVM